MIPSSLAEVVHVFDKGSVTGLEGREKHRVLPPQLFDASFTEVHRLEGRLQYLMGKLKLKRKFSTTLGSGEELVVAVLKLEIEASETLFYSHNLISVRSLRSCIMLGLLPDLTRADKRRSSLL